MEENLIKLELDSNILKDFDSLMSIHLDKVEELVVSGFSTNSKFYNIIGLCTNLKIIKITKNLKINTNNIITNIFKPELIEVLEFDGVRLPNLKMISNFKNLKTIKITNVRYSSVKAFLGLICKDKVEDIYIENTDFCKASISMFNEFKNLKYLTIKKCENCKYDDYSFVSKNYNLDKIEFDNASISFEDLPNIFKGKAEKIISAELGKTTKKSLVSKININNDQVDLMINSSKLKILSESINFNKIDNLLLIINKNADLIKYMKLLKRVKKDIVVSINDLSVLDVNDAQMLKEQLNIKKIKITNDDTVNGSNQTYSIDDYIKIRERIDTFSCNIINDDDDVLAKVVKIYKAIILSSNKDVVDENGTDKLQLTNIVNNIYTDYNYAELLYHCLNGLEIPVNIVKGVDNQAKTRYWNQIKIYDYWYNVDLYLDSKESKNLKQLEKKPKNFLVVDKIFLKSHKPQTTNYEHCVMEMEKSLLNTYFKKTEKDEISWMIKLINKIKRLFVMNKKALPAPEHVEVITQPLNVEPQNVVVAETVKEQPKKAKKKTKKVEKIKYSKDELDILSKLDNLDIEDDD